MVRDSRAGHDGDWKVERPRPGDRLPASPTYVNPVKRVPFHEAKDMR